MDKLRKLMQALNNRKQLNPEHNKEKLASWAESKFCLSRLSGTALKGENYCMRFVDATGESLSNTIWSLRALKGQDHNPVVICVCRPRHLQFLLANSTFIRKASHSSHELRMDNIRGSFNGTDIIRFYGDEKLENAPENFQKLFKLHKEFSWEENLRRIVEETARIRAINRRFEPTESGLANIYQAITMTKQLSGSPELRELESMLASWANNVREEILRASTISNAKQRGDKIESLILGQKPDHQIDDTFFALGDLRVLVDIKSKVVGRNSNPKAYNIDKLLNSLAQTNTVFYLAFVRINQSTGELVTRLVSPFDDTIRRSTTVQFHWAGRNSRGVAQFTRDYSSVIEPDYIETIDEGEARIFVNQLIDL